jgi:hypothetical protein
VDTVASGARTRESGKKHRTEGTEVTGEISEHGGFRGESTGIGVSILRRSAGVGYRL